MLLLTWFPQDSYGVPATTAGTAHIVLAGAAGAVGTAATSPAMGLLVRLPIGALLLWLAAVSWYGLGVCLAESSRRPAWRPQ